MKDNNTRHNQIVKQMITMCNEVLKFSERELTKFKKEKNEMKLISSSYLLAMELVIPSTFHEPR
jgi:hypothetical protein